MNTTYVVIAVALILIAITGTLLVSSFTRRKRSERFQDQFGDEYDLAVNTMGSEKNAQAELNGRREHIETLNIRPLTTDERERYLADWTAVQSKFIDEPREATVEADHLIMEVMQIRDYPVSDFDQRAADISISYPDLVSNYRAARATAVRNENHHAGTEDLRLAMINYRSVFDELLKTETVDAE